MNDDVNLGFSERLAMCMSKRNVKQIELAQELGLSQSTISRALSGGWPKAKDLMSMAKYFGVTMEWLLVGDEARATETLRTNEEVTPYQFKEKLSEQSLEKIYSALEDFQKSIDRVKEKLSETKKP
jgi:transcriptional regulator with XRE-family HTH domain